jgi:GAF domain-containing protein
VTGPEIEPDPAAGLARDLEVVVRSLFRAGSVEETLQAIVTVARESIEGCEYAEFFSNDVRAAGASLSSGQTPDGVGALQRRLDEGPCIDANARGTAEYAGDLTVEERWQRFAPQAAAMGIRSVLALPLVGDGAFGVLSHLVSPTGRKH